MIQYPSTDCLVLEADDGVREVPLLAPYVVEIDLESRRVVVDHLEDFEPVRKKPKKKR